MIQRLWANDPTLVDLDLSKYQVVGDVNALAEALKVNTTLTKLNLDTNSLRAVGTKAIAEALKVNTTLSCLTLGYNQMGDEGAKALANVLKVNTTLTCLEAWKNGIGDEGAKAMAEALRVNNTLKFLDLGLNLIDFDGLMALENAISNNGMITRLKPNSDDIRKILDRNKRAHEKARKAVIHLLAMGKHRLNVTTNDTQLTAALRMLPRDIYVSLAQRLWATRGNSSWWTEERKQKTLKVGNDCIQCNLVEARFMEETQPENRFCSELCQWMLRVGSRHGIAL